MRPLHQTKKSLVNNKTRWKFLFEPDTRIWAPTGLFNTLVGDPSNQERVPGVYGLEVSNYGLEVSEFEFQSCFYVHFRTNFLGKGMNILSFQLWVK